MPGRVNRSELLDSVQNCINEASKRLSWHRGHIGQRRYDDFVSVLLSKPYSFLTRSHQFITMAELDKRLRPCEDFLGLYIKGNKAGVAIKVVFVSGSSGQLLYLTSC